MPRREEINLFMKYFYLIVCLLSSGLLFAQESLEPIGYEKRGRVLNPLKSSGTFDSTFVYTFDTLQLPIFDEFSHNKFQDLSATQGAPNVTEQLFHRLLDGTSVPLPSNAAYTSVVTKKITVQNGNVTEADLPSSTIQVGSLASYPVVYGSQVVYPPYFVYDTLDFVNDPDTVYLFQPEYTQDSARLFTANLIDQEAIWTDYFAYRNFTHAKNPWTLGVVTFDGLDETGYPYNFGTTTVGYADFLTSKTIDLSSFAPNDSIYLSFLVQTEGLGDEPELSDSLVLEFFNAGQDDWERVWSIRGGNVTDFKVGHIRITQSDYLTNGFRFRFKNYGGLSGMLDEFHLDYVHLRSGSGYQDTLFKDFAFVYPLSSLIENYTQVPWDHWVNDPTHMNPAVKATVRNGSNVAENNINGTVDVKVGGVTEGSYTMIGQTLSGGNINYAPRTVYESIHDFSTGYVFSTMPSAEEKTFEIIATASAPFPNFTGNDTSYTIQYFGNEYAYDDGSAEAAYGVVGTQARIAYRFVPYEADTLIGVKIHFVPSVFDLSNKLFLLTVWSDNGGLPGSVLYQDDFLYPRQPVYEEDRGVFTEYYLTDTAIALPNSPFFVGWRQVDADRLNIGFDRNNDQSSNTFYSLNGGASWIESSIEGAMMMRPIFSTAGNADLGMEEPLAIDWQLYPNPALDLVSVHPENGFPFNGVEIFDQYGTVVVSSSEANISLIDLAKGVYYVRLIGYPVVKTMIKL